MSPNVGNFVHDLVEMAKAMETLPQVQLELDHAKLDQHNLSVEIDRLKADLEQSRTYAASLEQRVRTVEAERDDAEIRFLELDEKAAKVVDMLVMVKAYASDAKETLSPPKPQPEPEPVQTPIPEAVHSLEPDWKQDQAETSTMPPQGHSESPPISGLSIGTISQIEPSPASQDQSEGSPTNPVTEQATSASSNDAKTSDVGSIAEPSGPYTGKRYYYNPSYVAFSEWIEGGGTVEDYNWRPRADHDF